MVDTGVDKLVVEVGMVAEMEVDMVADKVADMVADMEVDLVTWVG